MKSNRSLGLRLAREALRLDPTNRDAQVAQISLALEKAIERVGFDEFPAKDQATFAAATASGPSILGDVLKTAIADGKTDLAAAAARALGQVTDPGALAATRRPHPLVDALYAPGRRAQIAAAKALVNLAPSRAFPGSSRVVPTLARFVINQPLPRAIIIDGNPNRGSQIAGFLITLGYDSELELTGSKGFRAAVESADVELILISFDLFRAGWACPIRWPISRPTRGPRRFRFSSTARSIFRSKSRTCRLITRAFALWSRRPTPNLSKSNSTACRRPLTDAERAGYAREA